MPVYASETNNQISEETMFNVFLPKFSLALFVTPVYVTTESLRHFVGDNMIERGEITPDDLFERRSVICGEPKLCAKRLEIAVIRLDSSTCYA